MDDPKSGGPNHGTHGSSRKAAAFRRPEAHLPGEGHFIRKSFCSVSFRAFPWFNCPFQDDEEAEQELHPTPVRACPSTHFQGHLILHLIEHLVKNGRISI